MSTPAPSVILELLKPITWFAPMWAFLCGILSPGVAVSERWPEIVAGIVLAGPLVCGTSQAVNDWYDRHVDAINEPTRPIPSGRMPGTWGLRIALVGSGLSLLLAAALGWPVLLAAVFGLALAWGYSAPPLRLKQNGWWGNAACGLCYEGLPWFTGAAIMSRSFPSAKVVMLALLYSIGAHGIMTLNDFKSVAGDARSGVNSLPVLLGVDPAARLACAVMVLPQLAVAVLLSFWGKPAAAAAVTGLVVGQLLLMSHLLQDPKRLAAWYNGTGTLSFVLGMLAAAIALRP